MRIRSRRGFGALVLLIVVALGVVAIMPMITAAADHQITGIVSDCGTGDFIDSALVVLKDANGEQPPRNDATDLGGVFSFTPPSGSYNLEVTKTGYFSGGTSSPLRFDGTTTVNQDVCLTAFPTPAKVLQVTVRDAGTNALLKGALVQAFYVPVGKVAVSGTTDASGNTSLTLWAASFELRTTLTNYSVNIATVDVASVSSTTVLLSAGGIVQGHARDQTPSGVFLSAGLVGFLYNPSEPLTSGKKVIRADVFGTLYRFHAPAGTYTLVIDANGYRADVSTVVVVVGSTVNRDVVLQPAANEVFATTVAYKPGDWNNLTIYRNLTLNADSSLPTLSPAGFRDLRIQVDFSLGNGNGAIDDPTETTNFHDWLVANGPFYVATDGNFTTNGKAYLSSAASYVVTVAGLTTPGGKVWINTTATYALKVAPPFIAPGAPTYNVTLTMIPDKNVSVYQDYVYTIAFPRGYELNTSSVVPAGAPVTIKTYAPATIDPGVPSNATIRPQIRMVISHSLSGTARAKVTGPVGKFYVLNATFTNYQALVAKDTALTFSAADSFDPNGHVPDANFTWKFTPLAADIRYGIEPQFKYTLNGKFTVNLTLRETGGNRTFRDITLFVDDQLPIARIKTNRTNNPANNMTLKVDEGIPIKFDGGLSTDLAYPAQDGNPEKNGTILDSGYSWDFDGNGIADATGRTVTHTFQKPGNFTVNLTVTDSVGWKSANASMTALVNDTKAPVPAFDTLDPSNDWAKVTSPMERKTYSLNASRTTDDFTKLNYSGGAGLNFTWRIPGPISVGGTLLSGNNHTFYGVNITFAWQEWNISYTVRLSVNDTGFPSNKKNTGYLNQSLQVQIDPLLHANLKVVANTMKVSPADPEESAPVTVTANFTNVGRGAAEGVTTQLISNSAGQTTVVATQADWLDKNGASKANRSIAPGETVTFVFHASLSGQGNKTLEVYVYDSSEPYTWIDSGNRISQAVNVRQPFWQPYAIYGGVIAIIALFVFAMYARRKVKAGEWRPLRGRREKGGEEKEKPRREIKEEKKRL